MLQPERYESNKSLAARDAAEAVPKLIKRMNWKRGQAVQDYGCGARSTGYKLIFPQVEEYDGTLYSVDISEKMLEFARKNYSNPRIHYAQGEILQGFPFDNVQFDNIFAIYVFHFIPKIRNSLRKFHSIMKPGGRMGFTIIPKADYFKSFRALGESKKWKKYMRNYKDTTTEWMNYEDGRDNEIFQALLQEAGFQIVNLEVEKTAFTYDDIETYLEFYLSVNPFINNIPKDLLPSYKEDLRGLLTGYAGVPFNLKTITVRYEYVLGVVEKPRLQNDNENNRNL